MTKPEIDKALVKYAYDNFEIAPHHEEYEKMISLVPYDCFHKDLMMRRMVAHEQALDYGNIRIKDYDFSVEKHQEARVAHLRKIFGSIQSDFFIEPPFFVDYGCNVKVGKMFYGNFNLTFLDCTLITFGDGVLVGPNCCFTTATHPTDPAQRLAHVEYAAPIHVGNNVWFGANVTVLPGVTIGDNAVLAAGAVVNKDVAANTVVAGCPARVIRQLTPPDDWEAYLDPPHKRLPYEA